MRLKNDEGLSVFDPKSVTVSVDVNSLSPGSSGREVLECNVFPCSFVCSFIAIHYRDLFFSYRILLFLKNVSV